MSKTAWDPQGIMVVLSLNTIVQPSPIPIQATNLICVDRHRVALLEVCTGSKLKPEPGPYPRSSDPTRPDPTRAAQLNLEPEPDPKSPPPAPVPQRITKKRKKVAFHDCMQRNGLIKALPFHKHLPVMKVCEHQAQRSHTFCRVYEFFMDKEMMTVQIMVIFCQLRLVSILTTLNQT